MPTELFCMPVSHWGKTWYNFKVQSIQREEAREMSTGGGIFPLHHSPTPEYPPQSPWARLFSWCSLEFEIVDSSTWQRYLTKCSWSLNPIACLSLASIMTLVQNPLSLDFLIQTSDFSISLPHTPQGQVANAQPVSQPAWPSGRVLLPLRAVLISSFRSLGENTNVSGKLDLADLGLWEYMVHKVWNKQKVGCREGMHLRSFVPSKMFAEEWASHG